jgi:predicted permease
MALRVSIGAGRWRLVRLMLVESALLAASASALGALFAWWAAPLVVSQLSSPDDPVRLALGIDWRLVSFGTTLTVVVALLFGAVPAVRASGVMPLDVINGGGRITGHRRLTRALIGAQAAFCVFVLFVGVLFVATFARLATWPLGFRADGVLVADADAPRTVDGGARWASVVEDVRALPGVQSVALSGWALLSGNRWRRDVRVAGLPAQGDAPHFLAVSPGFFATMQIPVLAGRELRRGDVSADVDEPSVRPRDGVGLVNQAFVRTYFGGRSPLGQRVSIEVRPHLRAAMEIVGVVGDAAYGHVRDPFRPTVYVPSDYRGGAALVIRTVGDANALAPLVRRTIARARPEARVTLLASLTDRVHDQLIRERLLASLSSFVAAVALLLSAIGLYGVLHHGVVMQQRQIGIRMALGAQPGAVVRHATLGLLGAVAAGAGVGLAAGLLFGRVIGSLLFHVEPTDPTALVVPLVLLAVAATAAALPPALRAVRIDPAWTLRSE